MFKLHQVKNIAKTIVVVIILLVVGSLVGCKSASKTITENRHDEKIERTNLKQTTYSPIKDTVKITLPTFKSFDKDCDSIFALWWASQSRVFSSSSNGKSKLQLYFDPAKKEIGAIGSIDSIQSKEKINESATISNHSIIEDCECRTPKVIMFFAILGLLFICFLVWKILKIFR